MTSCCVTDSIAATASGVGDQQQGALGFSGAMKQVRQLGIEPGGAPTRQVDTDEVDTGARQHPNAGHPILQ